MDRRKNNFTLADRQMWRTHSCAMPLSFPNSAHLHKWWGGRPRPHPAPWPACRWWQAPDSSREERDEGVPRGPGGPPSNYAESPALRKLSGIAHECVRHGTLIFRELEDLAVQFFDAHKEAFPRLELGLGDLEIGQHHVIFGSVARNGFLRDQSLSELGAEQGRAIEEPLGVNLRRSEAGMLAAIGVF